MKAYSKCENCESTQPAAARHTGRSRKSTRAHHAAPVQKQEEEDLLQGKFALQRQDEEELMQGKFALQRQDEEELQMKPGQPHQQVSQQSGGASSGIPASVQSKMENTLNTDLSGVSVHPNSSQATGVGALAYTQGSDIHVAPGHYSPNTSAGKQLLGHELAHVAQQMAGRVQPTGEVGGLPLNDNPALEAEADSLGAKAV